MVGGGNRYDAVEALWSECGWQAIESNELYKYYHDDDDDDDHRLRRRLCVSKSGKTKTTLKQSKQKSSVT